MAFNPLAVVVDMREQCRSKVDLTFAAAILQPRYVLVGDCESEEVSALFREFVWTSPEKLEGFSDRLITSGEFDGQDSRRQAATV